MLKYLISERDVCRSDYKDVIHDPYLCDGDSLYVGYTDEFFYTLCKDYNEFNTCSTAEHIESLSKNEAGLTSDASTGKMYVKLDDGSEWYVEIEGTSYVSGWHIRFVKEQI